MGHLHFPQELAALPNWLCWRLEKDMKHNRDAKVPYSPHSGKRASASNPATWGTLEEAIACADQYLFSGIGFVFTAECGIVGIDIDHCLENGKLNQVAADILAHLPPTYIEISPSGTGLHIFLRGTLPPGGNRNSKVGVEMYSAARYFTMTGKRFEKCSDLIAAGDDAIKFIHEKYIATGRKTKRKSSLGVPQSLTDSELLNLAEKSKDGASFSELFKGNWAGNYPSQSEADYALCRKLAFWSGRNEAQIDRIFRQSALFREKWDVSHNAAGQTYGHQTVSRACAATTNIYTPPNQKRESEIFESGGIYYRRKGDKFYPITNFLVEPIEMILSDDDAQITCNFVTEGGEHFRQQLTSRDFSGLQKFKNMLNMKTIALSFLGSEGDLDLFKIHIYNNLEWKKKRGVKALGIYPRNRSLVFVDSSGAVGVGGKAVNDIIQLADFKGIESNILSASFLDKEGLQLLSSYILSYNEPAKTVPILAWCAGCFIKPHLKKAGIKFPHLFLIGEPGSGKSSSLERIIVPIVGQNRVYAASQVTQFSMMKESNTSNIIPQCFDEFKPSKMRTKNSNLHSLYNHFRDAYDWHKGVRGRPDQSQVLYDLLAPIVVAGEESADEAAIRERTIELLFSKKDLRDAECQEAFLWLCKNDHLVRSLGRSLLDTALRTAPKEVSAWHDEGQSCFSPELPTRIRSNLCAAYAGLCLVAKLCGLLGLSFDAVFPLDHEACAIQLEVAARQYLLDDSLFNKGTVEDALEVMSRMKLKHGEEYAFENNGQYIILWMKHVYDKYTKFRKDYAIAGEVLERGQFLKHLEHTEYFVSKNTTKRYGDKTHRSWVLDFAKLSRNCDVSEFVVEDGNPEE